MIDNSGSMKKNDPEYLTRQTVASFVSELSADQRASLLLFGTQSRIISGLNSAGQLNSWISSGNLTQIDYKDQWTDTAAAIELALYELKMNGAAGAEPIIIILTDGIVDTGDSQDSIRRREWIMGGLAQQAKLAGVRIFGIAFTKSADYELLQTLGQVTQGDYFRILSAKDIASVFGKINQQLRITPTASAVIDEDKEAIDAFEEFSFDLLSESTSQFNDDISTTIAESSIPATTNTITGSTSAAPALSVKPLKLSSEIPEFSGRRNGNIEPAGQPLISHDSQPKKTELANQVEVPLAEKPASGWLLSAGVLTGLFLIIGAVTWGWLRLPKIDKSAPEAILHDLEKNTGRTRIELTGSTTRIGRDPGRSSWLERPRILILENPGISRLHAILEYRPDGYWFTDQNSKNGCKINYEKSRLPRRLQSGDKIEIAKLEFIFELPIAEETDETVLYGQ
ncbi:MAG: VWA domain-containing protein [Immundisolibacteraceae bacterium]|nr:VWA domain-containing protein [Immundisolibacteraceae bacterium]